MSDKAWEDLVDLIDNQFTIDKTEQKEQPIEDAPKLKQKIEAIYFEKDNTKYKIERTTGPRIIDKKTFYSGHGVANHSQYVYDPDETSSKVAFFKQLQDGHFNEISPEELMSKG
jgi:hypothetical protein